MMRTSYVKEWFQDALGIFNHELKSVLHDGGVMIIFVVAGFLQFRVQERDFGGNTHCRGR